MSELKKCWHCGYDKSKVFPKRIGVYRRTGTNYQVCCNRCHARGALKPTEEQAIKAWNTRSNAEVIDVLEELKEECILINGWWYLDRNAIDLKINQLRGE